MRSFAILAIVIVALLALAPRLRRGPDDAKAREASAVLRRKVLTREFLTGVASGAPGMPRCVVMDWNVGGTSVATLVVFDDGTTSLYFSGGGGVIGAGAHDAVKRVAQEFRGQAGHASAQFSPASRFDLPPSGTSAFYVVTDSATLTSGPVENSVLAGGRHPLSALARAAQDVITQIRRAT
jgi:hypothetical protein